MACATGYIPVGSYNKNRLANLGLGPAAIDMGGAYTYLNPESGWEFSTTVGLHVPRLVQKKVKAPTNVGALTFSGPSLKTVTESMSEEFYLELVYVFDQHLFNGSVEFERR